MQDNNILRNIFIFLSFALLAVFITLVVVNSRIEDNQSTINNGVVEQPEQPEQISVNGLGINNYGQGRLDLSYVDISNTNALPVYITKKEFNLLFSEDSQYQINIKLTSDSATYVLSTLVGFTSTSAGGEVILFFTLPEVVPLPNNDSNLSFKVQAVLLEETEDNFYEEIYQSNILGNLTTAEDIFYIQKLSSLDYYTITYLELNLFYE